jgi:alkylation response protein AidB-like acyl-CoA dehydrogenase
LDEALNDDQRVLLDASTRFMEETHPLTALRAGAHDDRAFAERYRRQAGDLGWFSLVVPEEHGGGSVSDNGVVDAALVGYRRGRLLQPGSFVGTNVVARTVAVAGTEEQRRSVLPALMAGEAAGGWAGVAPPGTPALDGVAVAAATAGGHRLVGTATFVEDAGPDGWYLVPARTDDGPSLFLVVADAPGLDAVPQQSLDLSRRFVELRLDGVDVPATALVGVAGGAAELIDDAFALACCLLVAETVGAMAAEHEMTTQYAKDRIAFGRPIGSFQAIKHNLADTSLQLELGLALATAAAQHVGAPDGYHREAASIAKAFVGDAAVELAQNCFQVFGGIGYTWEHDQHLYLRRLTTDASFLGGPSFHRERLCRLSGV